ncbi:DNA mismatch repair endonuclease MutH [Permianibacter sp. IMCC34836]|uniref:DNA mismatch repair endonuclease MutH n=1 Tax=Permianibacter fluminis TaxID=2738515 RepID=UPI0015520A17|nr:DNA mismatch repair endonuclease MutH [Permianibacter fluminis]NQD35519.1 DNA mismatch repair endonuclease MutH [Permianibacter fluminis]
MRIPPPRDASELLARAHALAGLPLAELAARFELTTPADLRRDKGWLGQLMERALGASSGSLAQPDFPALGIELKTLPFGADGLPTESTWVCIAHLQPGELPRWEHSLVRAKLSKVLWLPVQDRDDLTLAERRIGSAFYWQPSAEEAGQLQRDYEEIAEKIQLGEVESISAHHGEYLQLRPKAANASILTDAIGPDGVRIKTLPRGFYLRRSLTSRILQQHVL